MKIFYYAELEGVDNFVRLAAVRGELRLLPDGDGAAQPDENSTHLTHGEIHEVSLQRLRGLDRSESPQFRRRRVVTMDGYQCWMFCYERPDFSELPLVPGGVWPGLGRGR